MQACRARLLCYKNRKFVKKYVKVVKKIFCQTYDKKTLAT